MSFPLGSLAGSGSSPFAGNGTSDYATQAETPPARDTPRWRLQLWLLGGGALWLIALLALATHHAGDPGFSTSGASGMPLANRAGQIGAWASDVALFLFGYSAWWLLLVTLRHWLSLLAHWLRGPRPDGLRRPLWAFWCGVVLLMLASCGLEWTRMYRLDAVMPSGQAGGILGAVVGRASMHWLGFAGSGVLWIAALVLGASLALRFSWAQVADGLGAWLEGLWQRRSEAREVKEDLRIASVMTREREHEVEVERAEVEEHVPIVIEPTIVEVPKSVRVAKERQQPLFKELSDTKLPQVDLLDAAPQRVDSVTPESLEMTSRLIEKKLKDFGVEVRVVAASPGPVITRYEIEPAVGVKGSQVMNLAKDLARALSLVSIRVVETIPGKNTMALELPNARRQMIRLAEILGSEIYNSAASQLTMGLGKDIIGAPIVADLAKMPHCLVAGTTGSGKSVGINAMILSLLYKAEARDVRLILIDPKMLEMSVYEGVPHLLCPVVTDMKQAANALNWCVGEMERRYKLMSKLGVRNLAGYNKKIAEAVERLRPLEEDGLVTIDADLQNDPADIPRMLARAEEGYDVVGGWRVQRKDAVVSRQLPSRMANWLIGREIVEEELLIHHGMQSTFVAEHGAPERIGAFGGTDPDGDGVVDEITEGQVTALTMYIAMQEVPVVSFPRDDLDHLALMIKGDQMFTELGCDVCHVRSLPLESTKYVLTNRSGGPALEVDLATEGAEPRISSTVPGTLPVYLYSDLKRHDMGPALADKGAEQGVVSFLFMTPPLWGLMRSRPYLHDARAQALPLAILAHGGEAKAARDKYAALSEDGRAPLNIFLTTLIRARRLDVP